MTRTMIRALLACAMLASPAAAQVNLFSDNEARERLAQLEAQLAELENDISVAKQENSQLTLDKQQLLDQIRGLSALVEETNVTAARQGTRIQEVDAKLSEQISAAAERINESLDEISSELSGNAADSYQEALDAYASGDSPLAEQIWLEMLVRYPDSAYEVATRIWLARLELARNAPESARDELLSLLAEFPEHQRIPDIYVLLTEIAESSGDVSDARYWEERLLDSYPASTAADFIRLDRLRSSTNR